MSTVVQFILTPGTNSFRLPYQLAGRVIVQSVAVRASATTPAAGTCVRVSLPGASGARLVANEPGVIGTPTLLVPLPRANETALYQMGFDLGFSDWGSAPEITATVLPTSEANAFTSMVLYVRVLPQLA